MATEQPAPPEGTIRVRRDDGGSPGRNRRAVVGLVAALVVLAILVVLLVQLFTGCWFDPFGEMTIQPSVGFVEPPRGAAAPGAIPFQGLGYEPGEDGQPLASPTNPVSPSAESQLRGNTLYPTFCSPCHGTPSSGRPGAVGARFQPPPPDLGGLGARADGELWLAITKGFGRMPPLGSRMSINERWDIVNYLKGLTGTVPEPGGAARLEAARLFANQCANCHGTSGQGALGPPLYPSSFLTEAAADEVTAFIRVGHVSRGMPSFAVRLSDQEIGELAAMLKDLQVQGPTVLTAALEQVRQTTTTIPTTTTTAAAPSPGGTPTMAPPTTGSTTADATLVAQGRQVFDQNCQSCHGPEGSGGLGPKLNPNVLVAGSPDAARDVIENGRPGTAMPAWGGRLQPHEIDALLALLAGWQGGSPSGQPAPGATGEAQINFLHSPHIAAGVQCLFCHSGARRGPSADLPPLELCYGCHKWSQGQTDNSKKLVAAFEQKQTVTWDRVYRVHDFVYFPHQDHVVTAKLACSNCHGDVASMGMAVRAVRVNNMGFCLSCHTGKRVGGKDMADCDICHK